MLSLEKQGQEKYYAVYSEAIYSSKYPIAHLNASTPNTQSLEIYVENPPKLRGTLDIFLIFRPYEVHTPPAFQKPMVFNDSSGTIHRIPLEVNISIVRGEVNPSSRVRFEGYTLELIFRLEFSGPEIAAPALIFGFNTTHLTILINEFIVDSKLQNNLCIILSGIFIGVDVHVVGKFILSTKKLC
jgi:hypothetical protein